ncbi:copper resistance protein NlpE [Flavobacterium sp. AJR]|jgi:uncharacterized lipoprotein NlpE involved in copper resistance|uniref:copper resistance protein NlpE n=1 Tax=Flavobacterium sp. AJR TaxID=1979369 RepID=UPI000A3D6DFB|nr:copper resistance protein NlpE [Flavobacterium sp. AJR]OUL61331.1 hypothetical protein B8T70_15875 [Flavobacterium sp. AJR]
MKKQIVTLIMAGLLMASCKDKDAMKQDTVTQDTIVTHDEHTSQNSLDWVGTYKGIIPCADCEGIEQEITINDDKTFSIKETYLGKTKDNKFTDEGTTTWNKEGNIITTITKDKTRTTSYLVGERTLTQLDMDNKEITGPLAKNYILNQIEPK